jgi:Fe2+ or Zn2+ uptake regulation protein
MRESIAVDKGGIFVKINGNCFYLQRRRRLEKYFEKLKNNGFKLTPRRREIIDLFVSCGSHLSPEMVWHKLKLKFKRCGLPGVYRNLEALLKCGILVRIQQTDRKKHYGLCVSGDNHHHHITCIKCGKVEDIKDCAIRGIDKIKGYKIVSHFMQVNGICASCRE